MLITSEITELERVSAECDANEVDNMAGEGEDLKKKLLTCDKSNKVRTATVSRLSERHCKPIKIVSTCKNN
jgi:hypothetical protein